MSTNNGVGGATSLPQTNVSNGAPSFGDPVPIEAVLTAQAQCPKFPDDRQEWRVIARALAAVDDPGTRSDWALLQLLKQAVTAGKTLAKKGAIVDVEAEAFLAYLEALRDSYSPPPPEPRRDPRMTCYAPRPPPDPVATARSRLQPRLMLLARLASADALHPATLCRIMDSMRSDVETGEQLRKRAIAACVGVPADKHSETWCHSKQLSETIEVLDRSLQLLRRLRLRVDELTQQTQTSRQASKP